MKMKVWNYQEYRSRKVRSFGRALHCFFSVFLGNAIDQTFDVCLSVGHLTHVAIDTYQYCNYYLFMYRSKCCTKHDVNVAVGISILESDVGTICIHIFIDVASVRRKILIGRPGASSAAFLKRKAQYVKNVLHLTFLDGLNEISCKCCLIPQ